MNLIFDLDDTIYNLMGPFQIAHEAVFADKTDVDCTEIFMRSRIVCDDILTKEKFIAWYFHCSEEKASEYIPQSDSLFGGA